MGEKKSGGGVERKGSSPQSWKAHRH